VLNAGAFIDPAEARARALRALAMRLLEPAVQVFIPLLQAQQDLVSVKKDFYSLSDTCQKSGKQVNSLLDKVEELQNDLAVRQAKVEELQNDLAVRQAKVEELENDLAVRKEHQDCLEKEQQQDSEKLLKANEKVKKMEEEIQTLKDAAKVRQQDSARLIDAKKKEKKLEQKIQTLQDAAATCKFNLGVHAKQAEEIRIAQAEADERVAAKLADQEQEIRNLRDAAAADGVAAAAKLADQEQEIRNLRVAAAEGVAAKDALSQLAEMRQRLMEEEKKNVDKARQIAVLEDTQSLLEEAELKLNVVQKQRKDLKAQVAGLQEELKQKKSHMNGTSDVIPPLPVLLGASDEKAIDVIPPLLVGARGSDEPMLHEVLVSGNHQVIMSWAPSAPALGGEVRTDVKQPTPAADVLAAAVSAAVSENEIHHTDSLDLHVQPGDESFFNDLQQVSTDSDSHSSRKRWRTGEPDSQEFESVSDTDLENYVPELKASGSRVVVKRPNRRPKIERDESGILHCDIVGCIWHTDGGMPAMSNHKRDFHRMGEAHKCPASNCTTTFQIKFKMNKHHIQEHAKCLVCGLVVPRDERSATKRFEAHHAICGKKPGKGKGKGKNSYPS
jgi:hypothetical protein